MKRRDPDLELCLTCKFAVGILYVETKFKVHIPDSLYRRFETKGYKLFTLCWILGSHSGGCEELSIKL
jgi:hypothetical protein